MPIRRPTFYPEPWASDEAMDALTPEEMATGYPSGTSEKPSRQSINGVLQYATNGVLYYLVRGVPEWMSAASYEAQAIVIFGGQYYVALTGSQGAQPASTPGVWEVMPWRKSDLDALYISKADAASRFLTITLADQRYYPRSEANVTFLRQVDAAFQFVTQAALDANYITREQADALFLTQAQGDARYARLGQVVTNDQLTSTLANYITTEEANSSFMTQEEADSRFMTTEEAEATFETQVDARNTFLTLVDAGLSLWNFTSTYQHGALVLDLGSGLIYRSLQDENTGNPLSDSEWWGSWPPPDLNGMMLNCLAFEEEGEFMVTADQIPLLADHPEGIYLRVVLKGSGGSGGWPSASVVSHGGGEGFTQELMLRHVTAEWFPANIGIAHAANNSWLNFTWIGGARGMSAFDGGDGTTDTPGAGGNTGELTIASEFILSHRGIVGAEGRWGVPDLRGGDGGGAHGSGGTPTGTYASKALYGCGGGGYGKEYEGPPSANYGNGFCLIYW